MSYATEALVRVHEKLLDVANKGEGLVLGLVDKLADLSSKAPKAPETVTEPIKRLSTPVTSVVGTRQEYVDFLVKSMRDWAEVQADFQRRVLDSLADNGAEIPVAAPVREATAKKA